MSLHSRTPATNCKGAAGWGGQGQQQGYYINPGSIPETGQKWGWQQPYLQPRSLVHRERARDEAVPTAKLRGHAWPSRLSLNGALANGQQVWWGPRRRGCSGQLKLLVSSGLCTDRKESFFGGHSVPPMGLSAREPKAAHVCEEGLRSPFWRTPSAISRVGWVDVLTGTTLSPVTGKRWWASTETRGR